MKIGLPNWSKFPKHFTVQLRMMLLSMFILGILRIIFFIAYFDAYKSTVWQDWLAGSFFDAMTVCIAFLPFSMVHLLPLPIHTNRIYSVFCRIYFVLVQTALLLFNLIDLEYFKFTGKRSTFDLFTLAGQGEDFGQLIGTFLLDFWWIVLLFIVLLLFIDRIYLRWIQPLVDQLNFNLKNQLLSLLMMAPIVLILGRGGIQLRPMGTIEAARFTNPERTALVLNSAFTMVKSYGEKGIEPKTYFSQAELNALLSPVQQSKPANLFKGKPNVVIIVLESFGDEWIASKNQKLSKSYTPFFDELIEKSLYFNNGYANGKKSIEAVPAIIASMPSMMNNPYITSQYAGNEVNALPQLLKKQGYSSAFYHGATNGSMRFDSYAVLAGFDQYVGRKEYNNDEHYDNNWGILDEYFNPWSAKQMSQLKQPFFSTLFTLSSHHPYYVPANRKDSIVNASEPIARAISYGDYSLKKFFEEAKKQPWYNNTLFVLCADHTPAPVDGEYHSKSKAYSIPILFYSPNQEIKASKEDRIFQQIDILPTILDLANVKSKYYSFGRSAYSKEEGFSIAYLEGVYYYFSGQFLLQFSNDRTIAVADLRLGRDLGAIEMKRRKSEWLPIEKKLKALIQRYNQDIIANQTIVK
ncbi:MAG: LTA synthase family protein [Bacteroidetes bacterium]|nr:LTA synthase family protein [Bacteroidota bacterium]